MSSVTNNPEINRDNCTLVSAIGGFGLMGAGTLVELINLAFCPKDTCPDHNRDFGGGMILLAAGAVVLLPAAYKTTEAVVYRILRSNLFSSATYSLDERTNLV